MLETKPFISMGGVAIMENKVLVLIRSQDMFSHLESNIASTLQEYIMIYFYALFLRLKFSISSLIQDILCFLSNQVFSSLIQDILWFLSNKVFKFNVNSIGIVYLSMSYALSTRLFDFLYNIKFSKKNIAFGYSSWHNKKLFTEYPSNYKFWLRKFVFV